MLAMVLYIAPAISAAVRPHLDISAVTPDFAGLANRDAAVRAATRDRLSDHIDDLADALRPLLHSPNPELRLQSATLLLRRPWMMASDDDLVRQLLANYGSMDALARCNQVELLMSLPNDAGEPAVLRILRDDPCATVRWAAVTAVRVQPPQSSPLLMAMVKQLLYSAGSTQPPNIQMQALAGWLLHDLEPSRAQQLLRGVVDSEAIHPTAALGQLDPMFLWLIDRATATGDVHAELSLLRQQSRQQFWDEQSLPDSLGTIFAMHATHGPLDGLRDDLASASAFWLCPQLPYCFAHWADRCNMPVLSMAASCVAFIGSGVSSDSHEAVGTFLLSQGWVDSAEREYVAAKWLSGGQSVDVWFDLARVAAVRDDDFAEANNLQEALQHLGDDQLHRTSRYGQVMPWPVQDAWAEVHWHFLRAAMKSHDRAAVALQLRKLLKMNKLNSLVGNDPELAADIVPALRTLGRTTEANRCFAVAYKAMRDGVRANPNDGEALNNLAWLCACTGEHLPEAQAWADRAIAISPAEAAFLDTDAEVHFRFHHPNQAAALETRALAIMPQDVFMRRQLRRYTAAARGSARRSSHNAAGDQK